jgi:chemotaxis protein MotA
VHLQAGRVADTGRERLTERVDFATLGGLIGGIALIMVAIAIEKGVIGNYVSPSAFMMVLGGAFMSACVAFPMERVTESFSLFLRVLRTETHDPAPLVETLVRITQKARREGLLALESDIEEIPDDFMKRGLRLVVDGTDPEVLREILENDIRLMRDRHASGRAVFDHLGRMAPAFGLIGTLVGLIMMLLELNRNPEGLGNAMAVALTATLYGVTTANLIFVPIANKLGMRSEHEATARYMMLEGIVSIQSGENPSVLAERLQVFLPPSKRGKEEAPPAPEE